MQTTTHHLPLNAEQPAASPEVLHAALKSQPELPPLSEYLDLPSLLPLVAHTFPTIDSIRWFARIHRDRLAAAGALIAITGRLRYHPTRFQRAAAEIGSAAVAPAERGE